MIFEENDLLLSRRVGGSFEEQIIRPNSGSIVLFDKDGLPTVVTTSSISVLSASYASNGIPNGNASGQFVKWDNDDKKWNPTYLVLSDISDYSPSPGGSLPIGTITGQTIKWDDDAELWNPDVLTTSDITNLNSYLTFGSRTLARNGTGLTITKGQVVKIYKAPATHSLNTETVVVKLAVASEHEIGSEVYGDVLGVASENINAGNTGSIITRGYLSGVNTSTGFSDGDVLYVSPSTSGSYTNIKPLPPVEPIQVGHVTKIGSSDGVIYVDIKQPVTLDFIGNVSSSKSPQNNSLFVYDGAKNVWYDKAADLVLSGSLSGSNVDAGTLTAGTVVVQDSLTALNITATNNIVVENDILVGRDLWVGDQIVASGSAAPFRVVSKVDNTNVLYVTGSRVGINNRMDPAFNLEVNGSFAASTKSFVVDHKGQPGKRLVHATLEGPEHAVFIRGRSNSLEIELPEYWVWLIDEITITVHLTAIGSPDVYYFNKIENNKIYIGVDKKTSVWNKLFKRNNVDFYYLINAERKDVDKLQTVI